MVLDIIKEHGSFSTYLWNIINEHRDDHMKGQLDCRLPIDIIGDQLKKSEGKDETKSVMLTSTPVSDAISKALKKKGCSFVGTTIMYAYLQAVGMINDHDANCFARHR